MSKILSWAIAIIIVIFILFFFWALIKQAIEDFKEILGIQKDKIKK